LIVPPIRFRIVAAAIALYRRLCRGIIVTITVVLTRETSLLLRRIRSEYREMPGLALTLAQARRLWHLDEAICTQVFDALIDSGFLRRTWRGTFVLA
jgi:hypothetical protein